LNKWLINEKPYDTEKGDTLPAGSFKKRDSVAVDVTPILDGKRGSTSQAYFRVIHSAFPSFALKEGNNRAGEVIELQLIGQDPDADKITYALEKPFLEGMTVDKNTGKITWNPADRIKGTYRFTASATDSDGTKTVKTFEFSLNTK
jgi:hypothetical protein